MLLILHFPWVLVKPRIDLVPHLAADVPVVFLAPIPTPPPDGPVCRADPPGNPNGGAALLHSTAGAGRQI